MIQKVGNALLEGNFLRKCFGIAEKCIRRVLNKLDRMVSYLPRKYYRAHVEIVPNRIAIMTNTFGYTCNPKYIYQALSQYGTELDIYWITKGKKKLEGYPEGTKVVQFGTAECFKIVYSAKIWLDNGIAFSNYFDKKEDQIHIQTMHGSLGIKKLDNAVLSRNARGKSGQKVVQREENNTNLVITNSKFEEDVFRTVFWHDTPMERLGHARTDILFSDKKSELIQKVRERLWKDYSVPKTSKIVLYGPTHRKNLTAQDLDLDCELLCEELKKKWGGDYVVLFRLHDRSLNLLKDINRQVCMFNVTDYPDIQELMMVTDVAITDYSSWIYDFVNTKRPGFIYATDIDRYNNRTGFYYPLEETPFPICEDNEDLVRAIQEFDMEAYQQNVDCFLQDKCAIDDGHSSERIAARIVQMIREKK